MKKVLKSGTFYFMLASLIIIFTHYAGNDSHGIVLFELNPIINILRYSNFADKFIKTGPTITCGSLTGYVSIYWYIIHFITFALYGLVLDFILYSIKKYRIKA